MSKMKEKNSAKNFTPEKPIFEYQSKFGRELGSKAFLVNFSRSLSKKLKH